MKTDKTCNVMGHWHILPVNQFIAQTTDSVKFASNLTALYQQLRHQAKPMWGITLHTWRITLHTLRQQKGPANASPFRSSSIVRCCYSASP